MCVCYDYLSVCECKVCGVLQGFSVFYRMNYNINVIVTCNKHSNSTVSLISKRINIVNYV